MTAQIPATPQGLFISFEGIDGAGEPGKKDPYTDPNAKPPPMSERVIGKVYPSPTGPKEWTGTGWRKATNG